MYDNMYASEMSSGPGLIFWIFYYALIIFMIVVMWKIFVKAGKPGWGYIIPIYSIILVLEITDRPIWWIILWFFFSPIMYIIFCLDIAQVFGRGTGFGIGMILLPFIFFPILAFDNSKYQETTYIESQPL